MRRANQKVEVAFYLGRRVGISDAINAFHQQNGQNHEMFNMAASMRKEYEKALSYENLAKERLRLTRDMK